MDFRSPSLVYTPSSFEKPRVWVATVRGTLFGSNTARLWMLHAPISPGCSWVARMILGVVSITHASWARTVFRTPYLAVNYCLTVCESGFRGLQPCRSAEERCSVESQCNALWSGWPGGQSGPNAASSAHYRGLVILNRFWFLHRRAFSCSTKNCHGNRGVSRGASS